MGALMDKFHDSVFVHPTSVQHGRVTVGKYSSLWASSVLRGDFNPITIGSFINIQDNCTLHAAFGFPISIGNNVTVAHNTVLHACTIEDNCMISMGTVVQDRAVIGKGSIVAAGAVVREGTEVPPGSIVMGVPSETRRGRPGQEDMIKGNAASYAALAMLYREGREVFSSDEFFKKVEEIKDEMET